MNQSQMTAQQQMADMSNMFNQQIMGAQDMYNMQIQQANAQALADQEAARAFMINQGRGVMPANLQIGATYGTPQLAGTQGFKRQDRRPTLTPAQTATAFTAPTLAATAATNPMMTQQPSVLEHLMSAKSRYDRFSSDRSQFFNTARQAAELTLPYLIREDEVYTKGSIKLTTPWQSVGSKGVVTLASKLMLALLPPQTSFFKLQVNDINLGQELGPEIRSELRLVVC
jgi:hypothetical protein